jgi:hypothetical protein
MLPQDFTINTHFHVSAEVKECVELYLHSPNTPAWRGAQLRSSTGKTLPLPSTINTFI